MRPSQYRLIRSDRKTAALELRNGELIVRVPRRMTDGAVEDFVESHRGWIEKHTRKQQASEAAMPSVALLTAEELAVLVRRAHEVLPQRVAYFAPLVGVDYGRITLRRQKTKWGSCSGKGNLNFNCLLMLMPPEVVDYVVVHELCHLKEMNHSPKFYREVERVLPDYRRRMQWLKQHGGAIMKRNP